MTTRPRNKNDQPEGGPHIRYVEWYTEDTPIEITGATNASPIVITADNHGFETGDIVVVEDVEGNTAANGTWQITKLTADTFELDDSTGNSSYTMGGTVIHLQPVKVKLLKWNPETFEFETYGEEFRVGDRELAEFVEEGDRFWVAWRRDAQQWVFIGGGDPASPYQLAVVTAVTTGTPAAYSGSGATRAIDVTGCSGEAMLLVPANNNLEVIDTNAFEFIYAHRDAALGVNDIIRVWASDGSEVQPGQVLTEDVLIFGEFFNTTEHLRRLTSYNVSGGPYVMLSEDDDFFWTEASFFVGPAGPTGPAGADGPAVNEGYAIDVTGTDPRVVALDPTEITGFAAAFQFFQHVAADTAATDPAWKTVSDYDATKNQMWWHQSGTFKFETTTDYGGAANTPQFLVNWGAGNGGEWQWKSGTNYDSATRQFLWHQTGTWEWETITGYSSAATQLMGHISGTWHLKTIAEWLNLLPGYVAANDQSIGHDASGATEWQDDEVC